MTLKALIVDHGTTSRISIATHLHGAGMDILTCGTLKEAISICELEDISILLAGPSAIFDREFCSYSARFRQAGVFAILSLGLDDRPDHRLRALDGGADDVLCAPIRADYLRARLRQLVQLQSQRREIAQINGEGRMYGFAEDRHPSPFRSEGSVCVIGTNKDLEAPLIRLTRAEVQTRPREAIDFVLNGKPAVDIMIIDWRGYNSSDEAALTCLMAHLRAQQRASGVMQMIIFGETSHMNAAIALDLGADDVVVGDASFEEIAYRAGRLLKRKRKTENYRERVRHGMRLAITDHLTGLSNRRIVMPQLLKMSQTHQSIAILSLDIDHFKQVNDRFGHSAGDALLVALADLMRNFCGKYDLIARVGGEEFLIATPVASSEQGALAGRAICQEIEQHSFQIAKPNRSLNITASVGVAVSQSKMTHHEEVQHLLDHADKALYASKHGGRNRVTLSKYAA